jgi:hypothetical protein
MALWKKVHSSRPSVAPDLEKDPKKLALWTNQVLIHSSDSVYLGLYNPPTTVNSYGIFFPSRPKDHILAAAEKIDRSSMNNTHDTFRTPHP